MPRRQPQRTSIGSGGGGNRTRVRGRTGQSVYKRRLPFGFARRPVGSRPTAGLVILGCRTSGDDVPSVPSPFVDAADRTTGRARSDALRYWLGSESECRVVFRTCCWSRLFYEADRGPRLAALPENRPRRNLIAPVCAPNCSRGLTRGRYEAKGVDPANTSETSTGSAVAEPVRSADRRRASRSRDVCHGRPCPSRGRARLLRDRP